MEKIHLNSSVFITEGKKGETGILRRKGNEKAQLLEYPDSIQVFLFSLGLC